MTHRSTPTVIVARQPVAGRERDFERWLRRLSMAAQEAPGHVNSDIQPPTDVHPGEWVIVYQFTDAMHLRDWLSSPERAAIVDEGADLVDGSAREQVVALSDETEPVTAVASFRVRDGAAEQYDTFHAQLVDLLTSFPGFLRSERFDPVEGVQDDTVVVFSFDTREHLDAWLESDDRRRILDEIDELTEGSRTLNVVGGFGGWFGRPGMADVKRWKQASIVLLALYPTTLVLTRVRLWLLPDVHWVLAALIGNVLGVIILSWVLMPELTRRLAAWLRR